MTPISSYQPFLIGQGQSKTGLFTYLDSWVKPEDAYDRLENAYVYRGNLTQRSGMILYPAADGDGALVYLDSLAVAVGDGTNSYIYTFTKLPVIPKTVQVWTLVGGQNLTMTDNGVGGFTGPLDSGLSSIDYVTGLLTINTSGVVAVGVQIWAQFGYTPALITTGSPTYNPIMGIKQFTSPSTGDPVTIVMDTRRASYYDQGATAFIGLNQFNQVIWQQFAAAVTSGPITTQWHNIARFSVTVSDTTGNIMQDNGVGNFITVVASATPFNSATSSINYTTGVVTVNYTVAPPLGTQVTIVANLSGDYFTGNNANFFNATNWRFNDVEGEFLYMTNNVDPVTLFNGTQLSRPLFNTTLAAVKAFSYINLVTIQTTLDIKVYKGRLLFVRPTLLGATFPEAQTIRFSQQQTAQVTPDIIFSPYNFAADVPGNGGFVNAPTGDWLMASQLIRDVLIVFATNSTWNFRFTANAFDPYRFDQINSTRSTNAPYGTIPYDTHATSMGIKGLISCDAVSVERYDENVIDIFENINQSGFNHCFGEKYDTLNQAWMLYPSEDNRLLTGNQSLIFNYLENTWAVFIPNIGTLITNPDNINALSCLGLGRNTKDLTWEDFAPGGFFGDDGLDWSQADYPWVGFLTQTLSNVLLAGDQNGFVYQLYTGVTDNGLPVKTFVNTKRFNPFVTQGQKARFGYLDIYYEINSEITLSINFYANNSLDTVKNTSINLDGPSTNIWAWKRIYLNIVAEFIQIGITNQLPNDDVEQYDTGGTFNILGMILHAMPSGRLTPGSYL